MWEDFRDGRNSQLRALLRQLLIFAKSQVSLQHASGVVRHIHYSCEFLIVQRSMKFRNDRMKTNMLASRQWEQWLANAIPLWKRWLSDHRFSYWVKLCPFQKNVCNFRIAMHLAIIGALPKGACHSSSTQNSWHKWKSKSLSRLLPVFIMSVSETFRPAVHHAVRNSKAAYQSWIARAATSAPIRETARNTPTAVIFM